MSTPQPASLSRGTSRPIGLWAALAALLIVPLIAMQFTKEVLWSPGDFLAAAALLGGVVLLTECSIRFIRSPTVRLGAILLAVAGGLLIWAEAAVGLLD